MFKVSIVILTFMFVTSCTSKMYIHVNDKRIPDNYYQLQTVGETNLDLNLLFQKFYIVKDKGERVLASKELSFVKVNKINSKNLVDIKIKCQINNPSRKRYNIWKEFIIQNGNESFSTKIVKQIYAGRISSQIITVDIPRIQKGVITTTIKFIDETNYPILILDQIKIIYK